MKYHELTGKTIQASFEAFHLEHPAIYEYFKKYTREIIGNAKRKKIDVSQVRTSSKLIINRIRWEISTRNLDPNFKEGRKNDQTEFRVLEGNYEDFKINDAFTSRYARLFQKDYPSLSHIFYNRNLRAA